jgi:hypothetical protein
MNFAAVTLTPNNHSYLPTTSAFVAVMFRERTASG